MWKLEIILIFFLMLFYFYNLGNNGNGIKKKKIGKKMFLFLRVNKRFVDIVFGNKGKSEY